MEQKINAILAFLTDWLYANVLTWETAAQWGCVLAAYVVTRLLWLGLERRLAAKVDESFGNEVIRAVLHGLVDVGNVVMFLLTAVICQAVFARLGYNIRVISATRELALAWIAIRMITSIMPNRTLARTVAAVIWAVAALSVFGLLSPVTDYLGGINFSIGDQKYNVLGMIKGLALALLFLQAASLASGFFDARIRNNRALSLSMQVLMAKMVKVALFTGAVLFAMSSVGIDLTSLAIFTSALGVGIGFGLRTIISNYVAGVILLLDNSIKPGDTIQVGDVYGVVSAMQSRYASVLTRDGFEYLIPNETLISGQVVNWTHTDNNVRLKVEVGISYGSDVEKALELLSHAADSVPRVLKTPVPVARMVGFGDSSVNLDLRFWINDAADGIANVRSDVMRKIWSVFHENGVEFPFPQRDVLLKADSKLAVTIEKGKGED